MKIAPIIRAILQAQLQGRNIQYRLVHTGQHYDEKLSQVFFKELEIPEPDVNLGVGSGSQAEQTARIMVTFERDLAENPVDLVIVVGDVNSTMACAIVAKKMNTRVAHVEGGIRSFDLTMPEEINRMVTDAIADYFFTTSEVANKNLIQAGIEPSRIFYVGNTMIDTLIHNQHRLRCPRIWSQFNLKEKSYFLLTLHRPSNVDDPEKLLSILTHLSNHAKDYRIIFPAHPRTQHVLRNQNWKSDAINLIEPMSYLEFNFLVKHAAGVITDSGGVQEETTFLHIPCLTLRSNTERPETETIGTNRLIGDNMDLLKSSLTEIMNGNWRYGDVPPLWDGKTSVRIIDSLLAMNF
ncbi:MAG: UDP-N-acetylglucosamine 2-epimerase (non-hydrolyzing) [Cyclobacteriaceae bacterium]|nr:UDP-N-acetylglucosamine 2-epimerase (non-hydrolyzing) [Cyclobacteriaceae bacterium]